VAAVSIISVLFYLCFHHRTGDISTLDAHAVVACNNETFTDIETQTSALFERAGPELRREVVQSVKGMQTY